MSRPFSKAWSVLKNVSGSFEEQLNAFKEEFPEVYASRAPQNWNSHSIASARRLHTAPQTGDWPEWHVNYNKENEKLPPIPEKTALERFVQSREDPAQLFWDRLLLLHHEHGEEAALRYIVEQGGFPPQEAPALLAEALKPDNQMRDEEAEEYDAQGNEGE